MHRKERKRAIEQTNAYSRRRKHIAKRQSGQRAAPVGHAPSQPTKIDPPITTNRIHRHAVSINQSTATMHQPEKPKPSEPENQKPSEPKAASHRKTGNKKKKGKKKEGKSHHLHPPHTLVQSGRDAPGSVDDSTRVAQRLGCQALAVPRALHFEAWGEGGGGARPGGVSEGAGGCERGGMTAKQPRGWMTLRQYVRVMEVLCSRNAKHTSRGSRTGLGPLPFPSVPSLP